MFTGKLFELEEFSVIPELAIKRGCSFAYAGKIPTPMEPRLVACKEIKHMEAAAQEVGISGAIIPSHLEARVPDRLGYALCENPVGALNEIQRRLSKIASGQWESFPSRIHPEAEIMDGAYVAPHDVIIEKNVTIFPNATILPRSVIEEGSTIGAGTIIGTDAFEVDMAAYPRRIVSQSGGVWVGKNVDIQAKCTIVRATFGGFTKIEDETKIDCQVHVAHDCRLERRARIAACAELSGRVTVDENAFIGPNSSISNGIRIGRNSHITIGSVVTRDVDENTQVTGNFAISHRKWLKFLRSIR